MILNLSELKSNITLRLTNKNLTIIVCEIIFFIYIFIEENLWNIIIVLYYFNINVHYTNIVIYIYKSFPIKVNTKPFVIVNTR